MILVLKLITGEEIIGEVEQGEVVVVKQPCYLQIIPARGELERTQMALVPYAMYVEDHTIMVATDSIIWTGKPVKEIYNQYNSIFGSGIQLAGV